MATDVRIVTAGHGPPDATVFGGQSLSYYQDLDTLRYYEESTDTPESYNSSDIARAAPMSLHATPDNAGTMSSDQATQLITVQSDLATAQQNLSDVTNNFNLLLKYVVTQFNEIPDGLESSFEDAMSAV